jgi:hypothetical protein
MAAVRYVDAYPPHGGGDDVDITMRASVLTGSQIQGHRLGHRRRDNGPVRVRDSDWTG